MVRIKHQLVLNHRGVKVYHSWKGNRALTCWFALTPGHNAEGGGQDFDVRELPEKYRQGLLLEPDYNNLPVDIASAVKQHTELLEAHKMAIRRAIDDGHDLLGPSREARANGLKSPVDRLSHQDRPRAPLYSLGQLWRMEITALLFVGVGIWSLFFRPSDAPLLMLVSVCFFGPCAAVIAGMLLSRRR